VELTTDQKGAIAEWAIVHHAAKLGVGIYKPLSDGERYDLIFDVRDSLLRVQCKCAPLKGDVVLVRCYSCRRGREGLRRRCYRASEVDLMAAYCADLDRCFLLESAQFGDRFQLLLRIGASRNNQRLGVNWADDFAFEARMAALLGP
jgi:hypothetical protein